MPSTTRRQKADRADRRAEIEQRLRAAIIRLVEGGETFTELSVERLVAEAGMSRSTFYVYFEDKAALLLSLEAASMKGFYDGARHWIERGGEVTRQEIKEGMRRTLERFQQDATVMTAVAETAVYDRAVRDHYNRAVDDYIRRVRRLIEDGRAEGSVRDVHPQATATALGWMLERTAQQTAPGASPRQLDALAEGLADVVWGTLFATA
jgi:AcrR family transcriptional regulator